MKFITKCGLLLLPLLPVSISAQTAKNFQAKDCNGRSHNLFSELDSAFVIVLDFVMPCSNCVAPSTQAYDFVQRSNKSNPGKVRFYMVDDYGNTPCSTLKIFADGLPVPNATLFSDTAIHMTDYGSGGMPKICIVAGWGRTVYYNVNSIMDSSLFKYELGKAVAAASVNPISYKSHLLTINPNPATSILNLNLNLNTPENVQIDLMDATGKVVKNLSSSSLPAGENQLAMPVGSLPKGIYFVSVQTGSSNIVQKFVLTD